MEGMRISENGRGFGVSISLVKEDVAWLVEALKDFYWRKGGKYWGNNKMGRNHKL